MDGWVKLYRKLLKWEWKDNPNTAWLFMTCLMMANYQDEKWHGITIKKGSFITSIKNLAKQVGLSVQQTRTSLIKLKSTNEITIQTTNEYSVISIQKWNIYQMDNKQTNKRITNDQQTNNKRITTTKNNKKDKNNTLAKANGDFGNPQINEGIKLLSSFFGYSPSRMKLNRYALSRLIKSKGYERVLKAMKFALNQQTNRYAPKITSYIDLEQKWADLEVYARREIMTPRKGGVIDATNI